MIIRVVQGYYVNRIIHALQDVESIKFNQRFYINMLLENGID